eukprot:Clim_evm23s195 gene=Clim_evmTU23s195
MALPSYVNGAGGHGKAQAPRRTIKVGNLRVNLDAVLVLFFGAVAFLLLLLWLLTGVWYIPFLTTVVGDSGHPGPTYNHLLAQNARLQNELMMLRTASKGEPMSTEAEVWGGWLDDATAMAKPPRGARKNVEFVFGIPTVSRKGHSYLVATIESLLQAIPVEERMRHLILVQIADRQSAEFNSVKQNLHAVFETEIEEGLLEIFGIPEAFHPTYDGLKQRFGDDDSRVRWRSKQNVDFSHIFKYAAGRGDYFIMMEDDVKTHKQLLPEMRRQIQKQSGRTWYVLSFCSLGFIGRMFHDHHLWEIGTFFKMFYEEMPVDWLLIKWKAIHDQEKWIRSKPSLFQHMGTISSLDGKTQHLKDNDFEGEEAVGIDEAQFDA